mmetsp:Transcript_89609/g.141443  ORF Transcript_89609/g.141443 Transcript_89609/m.141443 type:complete len:151 (+) Transcript_89609:93-545(+)
MGQACCPSTAQGTIVTEIPDSHDASRRDPSQVMIAKTSIVDGGKRSTVGKTPEKIPEVEEPTYANSSQPEEPQKAEPPPPHAFMNGPTMPCKFEGKKKCPFVWTDSTGYYNGEYTCDRCKRPGLQGWHWHCPEHYGDYCNLCRPKELDGA